LKKIFIPTFIIVLFDQTTKIWVKLNMSLGQEYEVFNWFFIHFTENNGMAFGVEFGGYLGKSILSVFRIIIVGVAINYLLKMKKTGFPNGLMICLGLILGGAIGNIIDSCFYGIFFTESYYSEIASIALIGNGYSSFLHGKVVDMLYFPIINTVINGDPFVFFRPVFNVADSAISIGVFIILIFYRKNF
jgi:signal peptidase II